MIDRPRRARTVLVAMLLLAVAVAAGSSSVGASTLDEPPIVSSDYFQITSYDHEWEGGVTDDYGYLWSPKCKKGKQKVTFLKTIAIPGPPQSVYVDLSPRSYVKKLQLVLDGQVLVRGKGPLKDFKGDLSPADAGRFTHGEHVLKIVAVKKKTGAGVPPACGVLLYLRGVLEADVGTEPKPNEMFMQDPYSVAVGTFTVFNDGPSASPGGTFTASFSDAARTIVQSVSPPFDVANCTTSNAGFNCSYGTGAFPANGDYFPVGGTATFTVMWQWFTVVDGIEVPSPRTDGGTATWSMNGIGDSGPVGNNGGTLTVHVCGVESPPPECEGNEPDEGGEPEV